jgi:hypothetical protein
MALKILQIVKVVHVINNYFVLLAHLKVVLHVELFDPLRAQVVHYHFRKAELGPLGANLLEEHAHSVRARECVEVGQVLALYRQAHRVDEALLAKLDALVHGRKHGVVEVPAARHGRLNRTLVLVTAETGK